MVCGDNPLKIFPLPKITPIQRGSVVTVSASFQKKSPTCGSVRVMSMAYILAVFTFSSGG